MNRLRVENSTHYRTADLAAVVRLVLRHGYGEEGRSYRASVRYTRQDRGCSGFAWYGGNGFVVRVPKGETRIEADPRTPEEKIRTFRLSLARRARSLRARYGSNSEAKGAIWEAFRRMGILGRRGRTTERLRGYFSGKHRKRRVVHEELPREIVLDFARVVAHELEHCRGVGHREMSDCFKRCGERRGGGLDFPGLDALSIRAKAAKVAKPIAERAAERIAERDAKARASLARWLRRLALAKTKVRAYRAKVAYYERRAAAKKGGIA